MKFILGKKQYMTQVYDDKGRIKPATVILATPLTVLNDKGGVGYGEKKLKSVNKAQKYLSPKEGMGYEKLRTIGGLAGKTAGEQLDVTTFNPGDKVRVSAISKGKGFQGVVKRHGFKGGRRSHGQKHSEREPGSIGATGPQRVFKGIRMAGRMGGDRVTVSNLEVLQVNKAENIILISGAVPGRRGTLVEVVAK